ncbi:protein of unknown function [Nocardia cyriacigeorgica GUH-2]|uniref:Uncharacterized protein n=1 Tax=Nocardia cyriacigeorgica (strain GUH-2) TaxID=1127134 RepID=H6RC13_NOCCG|nr:protein of unknown function [Nocardia cyriacigeorgica GUH-2]
MLCVAYSYLSRRAWRLRPHIAAISGHPRPAAARGVVPGQLDELGPARSPRRLPSGLGLRGDSADIGEPKSRAARLRGMSLSGWLPASHGLTSGIWARHQPDPKAMTSNFLPKREQPKLLCNVAHSAGY